MRKLAGFTLIEVLVFIVVVAMLMTTMLLGANTVLHKTPDTHKQWVAIQTARKCMEYFLAQRRLNGYDSLACPGTLGASLCSAPGGYSVSTTIDCTTWNGDSQYKTITVAVTGSANASLSTQIGKY